LNYDLYFTEGAPEATHLEDYHSHNTTRLDVDATCEILLKVAEVRADLDLPALRDSA